MSTTLEKRFLANIFHKPSTLEKTTLSGRHFSDITVRCIFTKLKESYDETNGLEMVNKEILPHLFDNNLDLLQTQDITTLKSLTHHIFSDYDYKDNFDWLFSENIIKDNFNRRKHQELFEQSMESLEVENIDTVLTNLELGLKTLENNENRKNKIIQAESFLNIYNEESKAIEELKSNNKPTYYAPSHKVLQKYVRMQKGWFCNIIGGTGCVDADTEYFNGKGWKPISKYQEGEKVLQYNEDGTSELVDPTEYHKYECESLWEFKTGRGLEQCLSDEHNVVYFNNNTNKLVKEPFRDIRKKHAQARWGFNGNFKTSHNYKGGSGIPLTDGKIRDMVALITKEIFSPFHTEEFSEGWYNCSVPQLEVVVNEVLREISYNRHSTSVVHRFNLLSKANADFIQFVFSSLNYKSDIAEKGNGVYIVSATKSYKATMLNHHSKVKINEVKTKDGYKYCFTVDSGMLVLRRNNNIFITGNSGKSLALGQEIVKHSERYDERCLYITDENSDTVILTYMYCNYLGLKYHDVVDRKVNLDEYISNLPPKEIDELKRVFKNIDVIELSGISTQEVRRLLKNARNNDNPYEWVGIDSLEEMNIDSTLDDLSRQNQNAIMCERIAKDFDLILWVTAQLKTDLYNTSIEKMPIMCNHGSKTLIKKCFFSLLLHHEYAKDADGDAKVIGFRGKLNKSRSGGVGKVYAITQNYDYCQLIPADDEIGNTF